MRLTSLVTHFGIEALLGTPLAIERFVARRSLKQADWGKARSTLPQDDEPAMLKITPLMQGPSHVVLKLEGRLLEPWLMEFDDACGRARRECPHVSFDLSSLSFVDAPCQTRLLEWIGQGITVAVCTALIAELLKEPNS